MTQCCQKCLDVPHDDLSGPRYDIVYCCAAQLELDYQDHKQLCCERQLKRCMIRVAALCAMLYKCNLKELFLHIIVGSSLVEGEVSPRFVGLVPCERDEGNYWFWLKYSSKAVIMGALCFSSALMQFSPKSASGMGVPR